VTKQNPTNNNYGTRIWKNEAGKFHRDENDLPAIIYANGTKVWYKNGKLHRENGLPAREYFDGDKVWYLDGLIYRWDEWINHYEKTSSHY